MWFYMKPVHPFVFPPLAHSAAVIKSPTKPSNAPVNPVYFANVPQKNRRSLEGLKGRKI